MVQLFSCNFTTTHVIPLTPPPSSFEVAFSTLQSVPKFSYMHVYFTLKSPAFKVWDFSPGDESDLTLTNLSCLERGLLVAISLWALLVFLVSPWFRVWCCVCGPLFSERNVIFSSSPKHLHGCLCTSLSLFSPHSLQGLTPHFPYTSWPIGSLYSSTLASPCPLLVTSGCKMLQYLWLGFLIWPQILVFSCKTLRKKRMFIYNVFLLYLFPLASFRWHFCSRLP